MGESSSSLGTPWLPSPSQLDFLGVTAPHVPPPPPLPQGKDLPTLKDMDFLNKNEKVYVGEEDQKEFMEKLKRDVEVGELGG